VKDSKRFTRSAEDWKARKFRGAAWGAREGTNKAANRFNPFELRPADEDRVALILGFLEAGYAAQLLLSSDTRRDFGKVARFVKQLRAAGVDDAVLRAVQADNPRRFLAFVPKSA